MAGRKGSVLVFTLLVLFMLLISALGIASVTLIERKTSGTTGKSTQSFQVADSGAEVVLQKIYKDSSSGDTLNDLFVGCSSGQISGSINVGKDYSVTLYTDQEGTTVADCADNVADIRLIKSVGSYAQTKRAVEVAVAQSGGAGCYISYNSNCPGAGCCLNGYTEVESVGSWGVCRDSGADESFFIPPGVGASDCNMGAAWTYYNLGDAYLCCQ